MLSNTYINRLRAVSDATSFPLATLCENFNLRAARDGDAVAIELLVAKETEYNLTGAPQLGVMFYVEYADASVIGERHSDGFSTLADAVASTRALKDRGAHPSIRSDEFTALPFMPNKWAEKPRLQWSMTFKPVGVYKSCVCRCAEEAGVRYLSHRRGYVASETAFRRFVASMEKLDACRIANADLIREETSRRLAAIEGLRERRRGRGDADPLNVLRKHTANTAPIAGIE